MSNLSMSNKNKLNRGRIENQIKSKVMSYRKIITDAKDFGEKPVSGSTGKSTSLELFLEKLEINVHLMDRKGKLQPF